MESHLVLLSDFFDNIKANPCVGPSHVSLYVAILQLWQRQGCVCPLLVKRVELMSLARIAAASTYHRILKDLVDSGLVRYEPGFDRKGSKMYV